MHAQYAEEADVKVAANSQSSSDEPLISAEGGERRVQKLGIVH